MGLMSDLIEGDLGDVDPREMAEHFRAVASLTVQQLHGMLGWAQQGQDGPVYNLAHTLIYSAGDPPRPTLGGLTVPGDHDGQGWHDLAVHRAAIEGIPLPFGATEAD
jgi:hypothetical protein